MYLIKRKEKEGRRKEKGKRRPDKGVYTTTHGLL
jgi:hypothetical protein